jgi:hypothetical protein
MDDDEEHLVVLGAIGAGPLQVEELIEMQIPGVGESGIHERRIP